MASELVVAPLILFLTVDFLTINGIDQTNCQVSSNQAMAHHGPQYSLWLQVGRCLRQSSKLGTHPPAPNMLNSPLKASCQTPSPWKLLKDPEVNCAASYHPFSGCPVFQKPKTILSFQN